MLKFWWAGSGLGRWVGGQETPRCPRYATPRQANYTTGGILTALVPAHPPTLLAPGSSPGCRKVSEHVRLPRSGSSPCAKPRAPGSQRGSLHACTGGGAAGGGSGARPHMHKANTLCQHTHTHTHTFMHTGTQVRVEHARPLALARQRHRDVVDHH